MIDKNYTFDWFGISLSEWAPNILKLLQSIDELNVVFFEIQQIDSLRTIYKTRNYMSKAEKGFWKGQIILIFRSST
jgi:hypothetical protein